MAVTPQGPAQGAQIPGGGLDEALKSITVDDMLSGLKPEDVTQQQPQAQPQAPAQEASPAADPAAAATNAALGDANPDAIQQAGTNPIAQSVTLGVAKAGIELKDLFTGEPGVQDRSAIRQFIEEKAAGLRHDSVANGLAMGVAQFGVGFIGLGKIKYVAQGLEWASRVGKGARFAAETARGAVAGASVLDPHEERLSNLVERYPALQNPISNYLAAKPEDSGAEGRLKNALEGIVLDGVLASGLALVSKSIKLARGGDISGANEAAASADDAFAKAARSDTVTPDVSATVRNEGVSQTTADQVKGLDLQPSGPVMDVPQGPGRTVDPTLLDAAGKVRDLNIQTAGPQMEARTGPTQNLRAGEDGATQPGNFGGGADHGGPDNLGDRTGGGPVAGEPGAPGSGAEGGRVPAPKEVAGTSEQVSENLARLKKDNDALLSAGGRENAIADGYRFKGSDGPNGIIPWQKLNTTEETQAWMGQIIDDQAAAISKARGGNAEGVLTDAAVEKMVQQRAQAWGEDPAQLMGILQAAGKDAPRMAANMETSFLIANKAFQDAYELAVRISSENFTGFASREAALKALQERVAQATTMYANGKAILSNSARSLRRMQGQFKFTDDHLTMLRAADPEAVLRLVTETSGDPQLLAKASRISLFNRIADPIASMQAANLLWGWKTQVVNFATSAAQLVWRPLETGVGSIVQRSLAGLRGDEEMMAMANSIRTQSIREVAYIGSNLSDGLAAAVKSFVEGDSVLLPHGQEHFTNTASRLTQMKQDNLAELAQMWRPLESVEDLWHNATIAALWGKNAVMGSLRILGAADELVKTTRYRSIIASKASLEADQRGFLAGTQEYKDYISTRMEGAFDPTGRAIDRDALIEAQTSVFQQDFVKPEMSLFGQGWAQGFSNMAAQNTLVRVITPFVKTPTNLFRYGVKLTPGVNLLQYEYWHALTGQAGAEGQARAMGQMTLGIGMAASAASLWAAGRLTGSGPQDVEQKKQWMAQGNRPFSLVFKNDKGEKQFFELSRFDPIGMPLTMVADAMSLYFSGTLRDEDQHGIITSMALAFAHITKDKTYLKNLNDALAAATDDKKLTSFAKRTAPGFLPMSSLLGGVNPDPVLHEVRTVMDGFIAKVPGWSATLPPQRDFLGDAIMVPTGFVQGEKNPGPLNNALNDIFAATGKYISPPASRSANTGGVDLRDFTMKTGRTAYDRYTELAGHPPGMAPLKDTLTNLVQSDVYQKLPHGGPAEDHTKAGVIMDVVKQYREAAWKRLIVENPDLRQAVYQRRLDISKAVAQGPKDVKAAGDQGRMDSINRLLGTYGYSLPTVHLPPQ